jgi:uncharacterized protein (DUF952 family)
MNIYHITSKKDWAKAYKNGVYLPVNYEKDGFIHCSKKKQVLQSANKHFTGQNGLIVLKIDQAQVPSKVIEENLEGGKELFPHIYGPIPVTAVVEIIELISTSDGFTHKKDL